MLDSEPDAVLGPFSSPGAQATPWASALAVLGEAQVFWYRLGEAVIAGDVRLYRVAPTVGFAFGKLPTSSQTRYTWPSR